MQSSKLGQRHRLRCRLESKYSEQQIAISGHWSSRLLGGKWHPTEITVQVQWRRNALQTSRR